MKALHPGRPSLEPGTFGNDVDHITEFTVAEDPIPAAGIQTIPWEAIACGGTRRPRARTARDLKRGVPLTIAATWAIVSSSFWRDARAGLD
jgi:hypothetical protein